jgi:hypothetical protein
MAGRKQQVQRIQRNSMKIIIEVSLLPKKKVFSADRTILNSYATRMTKVSNADLLESNVLGRTTLPILVFAPTFHVSIVTQTACIT